MPAILAAMWVGQMEYVKGELLGKGGFGRVYAAKNSNGEQVAGKEFAPSDEISVEHGQLKERFRREAVYQQKIDHPNIVKIIEYIDGEVPIIIMELADLSLKTYLENNKDIDHDQRVSIIKDMLSGLAAVHASKCTHRDIKPENVLGFPDPNLPTGYRWAISDFGLVAPPNNAETTLTMTGIAGGSTYYASPEAMKSMNRCDARSDIYSMGAIIFDLFVGKPRVPLSQLKTAGELGLVLSRATETNPSKRFQTIEELREAFLTAVDLEQWSPKNPVEQRYLEILSKDAPTEDEWDELDMDLQGIIQAGNIREGAYPLFRALKGEHLAHLREMDAGVFKSIVNGLAQHVIACRGWYNFDYCDVVVGKLRSAVALGDAEEQAKALLAILILGVSHNRWYVEKIFGTLAGPDLPTDVVERLALEAEAQGEDLADLLSLWHRSLAAAARPALHPTLAGLYDVG